MARGNGDTGCVRSQIRDCYKKIGISTVGEPEEEFVVGKANYAKGIRAKNLTRTPLYRP